jgi:hypothetical protein
LLNEATLLLNQERPLDLSQDLGQRLLQHMVEREGTVDPARQHYFIVNARKGFFDPHRQKGEERTHTPWHLDTNHHLGYLPLNLAGVAGNNNFQSVLEKLAKNAFKSLRERPRNFQPEHVHVLFFCNHGCHRSVGFCRLMEIVASEWKWERLSYNIFL